MPVPYRSWRSSGSTGTRLVVDTGALSYAKPADHSHFSAIRELLPDRDLAGVRKMQVGGYRAFVYGRNADGKLSKRRPVLPAYITHQAESVA